MKKLIFAVMMLMSTAASFAVEFSFAEVNKVAEAGNGFFAYTAGGEAVGISAYQYTQMKDADGYFILSVDGKKVVAAGDEFEVEELIIDSIGLAQVTDSIGQIKICPKVFFTNGREQVFTNPDWLAQPDGKKVRRIAFKVSLTNHWGWEFENYATVSAEEVVSYHDKVAPTKKATVDPAPEQKKTTTPRIINFSISSK